MIALYLYIPAICKGLVYSLILTIQNQEKVALVNVIFNLFRKSPSEALPEVLRTDAGGQRTVYDHPRQIMRYIITVPGRLSTSLIFCRSLKGDNFICGRRLSSTECTKLYIWSLLLVLHVVWRMAAI